MRLSDTLYTSTANIVTEKLYISSLISSSERVYQSARRVLVKAKQITHQNRTKRQLYDFFPRIGDKGGQHVAAATALWDLRFKQKRGC